MDADRLIQRLERAPAVFLALGAVASPEDARWKPRPEDWSILEIAWHVLDEEREDFRARLESTLRDPAAEWPKLDLDGVAEKRGYNTRDLGQALRDFAEERRKSIAWLRSLPASTDWTRAYVTRKAGPLAAGALLASWVAHDALHIRQMAKRLYQLAGRDVAPHPIDYAGEWRA